MLRVVGQEQEILTSHPLFDMGSEFYHLLEILLLVSIPEILIHNIMMLKILNNLGNPLYPAHLTLRNDIGHVGGPASLGDTGNGQFLLS